MKKILFGILMVLSACTFGQGKISELSSASALSGTELMEVVQSGSNKKSTTQDIANLVVLPKVYATRLTQSGTADPTAATGYNSTGATATIIRTGTGYGRITFSGGVMTSGKTVVSISGTGSGGYSDPKLFTHQISAVNQINLGAFRASDQTAEDGWVLDITITIYP